MGWLDWIMSRKPAAARTPDHRIPTVTGEPEDPRLDPPPARPRKRGVATDQYEADHAAWRRAVRV
ncbi:MAG: hypothetical protein JWP75_419 [Frondihabitans sp.]|nr:hypothetical protein [Frondihabitans sp.]